MEELSRCPNCKNDSFLIIFGEIEWDKSYVMWCSSCGLVRVVTNKKDFTKEQKEKYKTASRITNFYITQEGMDVSDSGKKILDESYSIEEVDVEIRKAGGDPEAIGKRGEEEVQKILERHKKFMRGDESDTIPLEEALGIMDKETEKRVYEQGRAGKSRRK
ncbi:MAG: hypothetical protein WC444_04255 [Candidatus Paceibacterota bacterium]